jgi:PBP1b-binding outer membrane lipoprotein LpoB
MENEKILKNTDMKKVKNLMIAILAILLFAACNTTDPASPSGVTKRLYEAVKNLDFETLKECTTENRHADIDNAKEMMKTHPEFFASIKKNTKKNKMEVLFEKISDDGLSATVKVKVTVIIDGESIDNESDINFVKTNDKWKADFRPF